MALGALTDGLAQGAQTALSLDDQYQQLAAKRDLGNSILSAMSSQTNSTAPAGNAPGFDGKPVNTPWATPPAQPAAQSQPQAKPEPQAQPAPQPTPIQSTQPQGPVQVVAQSEPNIKNQALPDRDKEYTGPKDAPPPVAQEAGVRSLPAAAAVETGAPKAPEQPAQPGQPQTTSTSSFPLVDPRPLDQLRQSNPRLYAATMAASQEWGVDPERIAAHMKIESGFKHYGSDGKITTSETGAHGLMQLMPGTANDYATDKMGNKMDPTNDVDNIRIGAHYISHLDSQLGKNSMASRVAYFSGEGNLEKMQEYAKTHSEAETEAAFPKSFHYARMMAPFNDVGVSALAGHQGTPSGAISPQGVMQSAQGGPAGLLSYIVQAKGQDVPLSDAWLAAEKALVRNRIQAGDMAGVQHAHDFILNMSHSGFNQSLQQADQALANGDGIGAAKALAAAHAFFPDGAMGQFGVDKAGNVWGQRMDPADPSKTVGAPFQVTRTGLMAMFNQSSDPKQYLDEIYNQRKLVSSETHNAALNDYYKDQVQARRDVAQTNADARRDAAQTRADATVSAAEVRSQGKTGTGPQAGFYKAVDKETADNYGPDVLSKASDNDRGLLADIHTSAREYGANALRARQAALGLKDGSLKVRQATGSGGEYGVVDPKKPDAPPIAYISEEVVKKLTGGKGVTPPAGGAAVQIGSRTSPTAGAPTLAGTSQSSAVPSAPQGAAVNTGSFGAPTPEQLRASQAQAAAAP